MADIDRAGFTEIDKKFLASRNPQQPDANPTVVIARERRRNDRALSCDLSDEELGPCDEPAPEFATDGMELAMNGGRCWLNPLRVAIRRLKVIQPGCERLSCGQRSVEQPEDAFSLGSRERLEPITLRGCPVKSSALQLDPTSLVGLLWCTG